MEIKPNKWSCMVTAYANAIGRKTKEVTDIIGHDGGEIVNASLGEPYNRRGFHWVELVKAGYALGFATVHIPAVSLFGNKGSANLIQIDNRKWTNGLTVPHAVIGTTSYGLRHSLTFKDGKYIDPDNLQIFESKHFFPEEYLFPFWIGLSPERK